MASNPTEPRGAAPASTIQCRTCGETNAATQFYCGRCGRPLHVAGSQPTAGSPGQSPPNPPPANPSAVPPRPSSPANPYAPPPTPPNPYSTPPPAANPYTAPSAANPYAP